MTTRNEFIIGMMWQSINAVRTAVVDGEPPRPPMIASASNRSGSLPHPKKPWSSRLLAKKYPGPKSHGPRAAGGPASGKDEHLVSTNLHTKLRNNLERLKKARVHRGLRHYWGIRVRGQHTKTTGRKR